MPLAEYRRKRVFTKTPEPRGVRPKARGSGLSFVVQKHDATRLHYDFRLELDGVLKSWAVPKGPSLDPEDKRLAVHVEDHPLEYGGFEGTIPEGEYGGGTVMLWDRGTWEPEGDPQFGYNKGHLKFTLKGARMKGGWSLVQMRGREGGKNWLLIKERDAQAKPRHGPDLVEHYEKSVASRRSMDSIAKADNSVWHSKPRRASAFAAVARRAEPAAPPRSAPLPKIAGARAGRLPAAPSPQLATLVEAPPDGAGWVHEIKFDGYRMLAVIDSGKVKLLSRNGKDWTARLPELAQELTRLPVKNAVLDGEVVSLQENGISSFSALKDDLSNGHTADLVYYLFDLLHLDGQVLTGLPLLGRKETLAKLLEGETDGRLRLSEHITGKGAAFFDKACSAKLEGIISKRADALYNPGRNSDWQKTKCVNEDDFVIIGWTDPGGARTGFGALLAGYYDKAGALHFAGGVGTGFNQDDLATLRRKLDRLKRSDSPAPDAAGAAPRHAHWVRPELVAQIRFSEWTTDGHLRHPAFLGLREDKAGREVVIERAIAPSRKEAAAQPKAVGAAATPRSQAAGEVAGVRLTHPDKLLYPEAGITKSVLAQYYVAIADAMLPHVQGRPLTMVRCPEGCGHPCFYQKHPGDYAPKELDRIPIEEKEGRTLYLLAKDAAGLVSLVQMGVLEIHVWGSTKRSLEKPDRIIFDLDPDEGLDWDRVSAAAFTVRDLLAEMELESFVKTTGGKGLHVVLPLTPKYDWEECKLFTHSIADELVRRDPAGFTATLSKKARHGKIFVDYLRNQRGATAIAPFSARAKPGATVSAPLTWDEVKKGWHSDRFTVATLPDRLKKLKRDPWDGFFAVKQSLPAAVMRKLRK